MDRQVELADDRKVVALQEEVVRQNTSGNGVFDRHHRVLCRALVEMFTEGVESQAFDRFNFCRFAEKCQSGYFVKACRDSLDGYPHGTANRSVVSGRRLL